MVINWYALFNAQDFRNSGLVSTEFNVILGDYGQKKIIVTNGVSLGITYEDTFLPLKLNGKNPFRVGEKAIFEDADGNVWLGVYNAS